MKTFHFYFEGGWDGGALNFVPPWNLLSVTVSDYRVSRDRTKNSNLLLFRQKDPFGELFLKILFKRSSEFKFLCNSGNFEIPQRSQQWRMEFITFNTPVQKEESWPSFRFHTVCFLFFWHSVELNFVSKFCPLLTVWKMDVSPFHLHTKFYLISEGRKSSSIHISWQIGRSKERVMLMVCHI